jgi:hypothetical protein
MNDDVRPNETDRNSQEPSDALVPEKSVVDGQQIMTYQDGIMSPVEGIDSERTVDVEVYQDMDCLASFACTVAETYKEKTDGLQPYNILESTAGMLFPYQRPSNVLYHMGSVKFPIDIIFVDSKSQIKKIYKNINPGSLSTFGCADVSHVLEICGGLTDRLGLSAGHVIKIGKSAELQEAKATINKLNMKKMPIIKYSSLFKNSIHEWKSYPIVTINKSLAKTASRKTQISDFLSNVKNKKSETVHIFDLDGILESAPNFKAYKTSEYNPDSKPYLNMRSGASFVRDNNDYKEYNVYNYKSSENYEILKSLTASLKDFMHSSDSLNDMYKLTNAIKNLNHYGSKLVLATRFENTDLVRELVEAKLSLKIGSPLSLDILKLESLDDHSNILEKARNKFGNQSFNIYSDNSLIKRAGSPVGDDIKLRARKAYKLLEESEEIIEKSLENMNLNLAEYDKMQANPQAISSSKGQYQQSAKRNKVLVRDYLVKIRDSIKILNEIKDISSTAEVIDSIANSAKISSEDIEEIFGLVDSIETLEFMQSLQEFTEKYEKSIEDLQSAISRAKDYINSDILGLVIISD